MDFTVMEMIREIAAECLVEGKTAKIAVEKVSGIRFPQPNYMQYSTYRSLATIWKDRKTELKLKIDGNRGLAAKATNSKSRTNMDKRQLEAFKAARRLVKLEKKRQAQLCLEMQAEERRCKEFYKWELHENLRERRLMREEERDGQALRRAEVKARAAAKSTYAVSAAMTANAQEQTKVTDFDRRRQELKDLAIERRRREEDQAGMIIEDKFGELLREVDRLERQQKQFAAEFGTDMTMAAAGNDADGNDVDDSGVAVRVPSWLKLPDTWDDWDVKKQMNYIKFHGDMRLRQKVIEDKAELDEIRIEKLEDKSWREFMTQLSIYQQKSMEAELDTITLEEETKEAEAELLDLQDNIRRVSLYCRNKGEEELKARTELRNKQELARRRDQELKEAADWVELCQNRAKNRDKVKRKITSDCQWMDANSIAGFHQRFRTELLRKRLYDEYFRRTVCWIANRAEIIATERRLFGLQERLSVNKEALEDRIAAMKRVWRSLQRKDLMRMRRSVLNQQVFPRHRRHLLLEKFSGWVRYYYWNRGHKEAFTMKYEIIKRQIDIDRKFKQQLNPSTRSPDPSSVAIPTPLQNLKSRPIQCKLCSTLYLESQNTSIACNYHSDVFGLFCPRSCSNPGLSPVCSAHRIRRWKCCDATKADAVGCSRRYHCPPDIDPVHEKIMNLVKEREHTYSHRVDDQLQLARKNNWQGQLHAVRQDQVYVMEENIKISREKIARFQDTLKLIS
jgi:hypothetical protein